MGNVEMSLEVSQGVAKLFPRLFFVCEYVLGFIRVFEVFLAWRGLTWLVWPFFAVVLASDLD